MSRKLWLAFVMIHNISPKVTKWPFLTKLKKRWYILPKSSSSYRYLAMVLPKFPPLWRLIWTLEPPRSEGEVGGLPGDWSTGGQWQGRHGAPPFERPKRVAWTVGGATPSEAKRQLGAMAVGSCQGVLRDSACYTSSSWPI